MRIVILKQSLMGSPVISGLHRILTLLGCALLMACSAAQPVPVSLPVPFGGNLSADSDLSIAEGIGAVGSSNIAFITAKGIKTQSTHSKTLTWTTFDQDTSAAVGTVTFYPDTVAVEENLPFPAGGVRRVYTMSACAQLGDSETCSSNFHCFEYPTDYPPNFSAADVLPNNPNAVAVVRKAVCSGNDDITGQLLDGRFLMGMVQVGDNEFHFYSQQDSAVFVPKNPFTPVSTDTTGNVVSGLITHGGAIIPPGQPFTTIFQVSFPGETEVVGSAAITLTAPPIISEGLIEIDTNVDFQVGNSRLLIRNSHTLLHAVPELTEVVRNFVRTNFAGEPGVTDLVLNEGVVFFNTIGEGQADPINCDPAAGEATGIFAELCEQFGSLNVNFLCFILTPPSEVPDTFMLTGVWNILKF